MQAGLAALALALSGGALVLLALRLYGRLAAGRRTGFSRRTASLLWAVSDALGDAAVLLDERGRIAAASPSAQARLAGERRLLGQTVEGLLGPDAELLRRGLERGPASGRLDRSGGLDGVSAVLLRVSLRPVRDLLVLRWDRRTPPPLPAIAPVAEPGPARLCAVRAELGALGAALLRPIERASTAAGLLRLSLTGSTGSEELRRIEAELAGVERRLRWLHAAGRPGPRREGPVDLAALVGELVGKAVPGRTRLRAQLAPASAWADPGRLRTVLREVLRAACDELPAGAELCVRVGPRYGNAVLELVPASEAAEAAALARALIVPEGGEVVVEASAGRGGLCRISFPACEPR